MCHEQNMKRSDIKGPFTMKEVSTRSNSAALAGLLCLGLCATGIGQQPPGRAPRQGKLPIDRTPADRMQDRYYQLKEAENEWIPYSIFVPKGYDSSKKWPV